MQPSRERWYGPWLVAAGAALWGTESAFRLPLNQLLGPDIIVLWEHIIIVLVFLPVIVTRWKELRGVSRSALSWLVFSGVAGSAVGTVFFTLALKHGNPTVVNVVLNIQPLISTTAACLLFGDRLGRGFFVWAPVAVLAGVALVFSPGEAGGAPVAILDEGTGYALICALFWGMSTVAGRGVMKEMSAPLASGLRLVIGLVTMTCLVAGRHQLTPEALLPPAAQANATQAVVWMLLLAILSGAIPTVLYFSGLRYTRASTAGYFEMMQTLAAVAVTWGFFHAALAPYQVVAGIALIGAVAMVQRSQGRPDELPRTAVAGAEPQTERP